MSGFQITSNQFNTSLQNIQSRYIKLELLNYQFQTVDNIEGVCTGGSISIDANSDIRRTGSVELVITDSSFEVASGGRVWLDKYARVWIGTASLLTGDIEYTNCGIFIIDAPNYQFNPSTNTLTLSLLDLMAKLTGIRNGYLPGTPVVLSAGENIRQSIIDTLALGGFTKYVVEEAPSPGTIPTDLEFGQGATVYDLLSGLRDIYPSYEMYFDVDGVFYYKPIPTGENEPVCIDDSLWSNVVIDENIVVDFQNVKNVVEVYGRTHNPAYFSSSTTVSENSINLNISEITEYVPDIIYGFTLTDNPGYSNYNLKINNLKSYPILLADGTTAADILPEEGEVYYCVQFMGTFWNYLGHLQSYGYAEDDNSESPFYVKGSVGQIRLPLYGGEYENCFSDDLAQQRAERELWLHTNMNNTIQLNCTVVPWMNVNILVQYTSFRTKQTNQYIIKSINFGLSPNDTMTLSMIQFYPESTAIVNN